MAAVADFDAASTVKNDINMTNIYDLNGEDFWKAWASVGGSVDEYIKESLPNYGLVGALLITVSIPSTISPPSFSFSGDHVPDSSEWFVQLYVVLMNVSTAASMAMIVLSAAIYQQFVNVYSKQLRIAFAAKFGHMVTVLTALLIADIGSLFGALFLVVGSTYSLSSAVVSIAVVTITLLATLAGYCFTTIWNSSRYIAQMRIDLQGRQRSKVDTADVPEGQRRVTEAADSVVQAIQAFAEALQNSQRNSVDR